jgi:hypothetical protein
MALDQCQPQLAHHIVAFTLQMLVFIGAWQELWRPHYACSSLHQVKIYALIGTQTVRVGTFTVNRLSSPSILEARLRSKCQVLHRRHPLPEPGNLESCTLQGRLQQLIGQHSSMKPASLYPV